MNLRHSILALVFLGALGLAAKNLFAQDPVEVAPNIYTVLFENEKVRVSEAHLKAGDTVPEHSHPDHLVYVLSPGKIRLTLPDGTAKEVEAKAGEVIWSDPETHTTENIGGTDFRLLVVELKS